MTKVTELQDLAFDVKICKRCSLCNTRSQVSISRGDPRSPLMIVSDFPRQADDRSGEILKGRTGKKLDELITKVGLKPEQVYMTALLKCWPGAKGHFPDDDSPAQCFPFLVRQIKIIKPLIVILSGPEALAWVLLRGTGEKLGPKGEDLVKWTGRTLRRREVYQETRFIVTPSLPLLIKSKEITAAHEQITLALQMAKDFIIARQASQVTPHIAVEDIEIVPEHSKKDQGELFKWIKPDTSEPEQPKS